MKKEQRHHSTNLSESNKDSQFKTQSQNIFEYLKNNIATASMVTEATGVPQKCFTRYKRMYQKEGILWEIERKPCRITGLIAAYLTTNLDLVPKGMPLQLTFSF